MADLVTDYLAGRPELLAAYAGAPHELGANGAGAPAPVWDPGFVDALNTYQAHIGASGRVSAEATAIVTGQQPALFGGPLYIVLKAATAVRLAARVTAESGRPCVPVFWLGNDDHDFAEAQSAWVCTREHRPLELTYRPEARVAGRPLYRVPIEDQLHGLIDEARRAVRGSELAGDVATALHDTCADSASFGEWTGRILAALFRDTPLVVFPSELPAGRALAAEVMARELEDPLATSRAVNEAADRLEELGYRQQVRKDPSDCGFFLEVEGFRRKVAYDGGQCVLPEVNQRMPLSELRELLRNEPERFSPNVALRPIVQQRLFPTLAYVGGPGELAYWAEFKGVFQRHGLPMPVVYPRLRAVLVREKERQLLDAYGLALDELRAPAQDLVEAALLARTRHPALDRLRAQRAAAVEAMRDLARGLAEDSAVAGDMGLRAANRLDRDLDGIERAIAHEDRAHAEAVRDRILRLAHALAPLRQPQERVYSVFSFLFETGPGLIPRLRDELELDRFDLQEFRL